MLAVNYSTVRSHLKDYCDAASDDNETVIVTRKDEKNVVLMGLAQYNRLMKIVQNAEYLLKIDRSFEQLLRGEGREHELIEVEDE
ncbi:MAG: type II toxin-antitoxin system Phd/YefM family antitoxin [Eubacterium sp.]|nr:type II toxin-antitoxin system Phd/YefM family antitoxin [Eubacterium sp.]